MRYHRKKLPGRKDSEFGVLTPGDRDRVRVMAIFLRTAELLNRGHANSVADAWYSFKKGDQIMLNVAAVPGMDLTLELMSLAPETALFTKVFGKKLTVRQE